MTGSAELLGVGAALRSREPLNSTVEFVTRRRNGHDRQQEPTPAQAATVSVAVYVASAVSKPKVRFATVPRPGEHPETPEPA